MITLRDVAADVGVSVSTVSLVLNDNDRGRVSPELAARVRSSAEQLGYQPNLLARSLKLRKTHTIGFLSESVASSPFSGELLAGAQDAAKAAGYQPIILDVDDDAGATDEAARLLMQRDVEALIIATDYHREHALPHVARRLPVVFLDCVPDSLEARVAAVIVPDEYTGARAATDRLLDLGHTRIAHVGVSDRDYIATGLRFQGYSDALAARGIGVDPLLRVDAEDPSTAAGRVAARRLLELRPELRPTAVFCFSDQIAWGVLQIARRQDVRVPEELAVIGFDNQRFIAEATLPALTTVQLPHRRMGELALEAGLKAIANPGVRTQHVVVDCPLVLRASEGAARPHFHQRQENNHE